MAARVTELPVAAGLVALIAHSSGAGGGAAGVPAVVKVDRNWLAMPLPTRSLIPPAGRTIS